MKTNKIKEEISKCKTCIYYKKELRKSPYRKGKELAFGCSFIKGYKNVRRVEGKCIEFKSK